jgi:aryl-alcohol dehydrogenase-like predicted oxidoreductase
LPNAAMRHRHIALAWLLHRSPVMLPIPGTSSIAHLEENLRAAFIRLNAGELRILAAH